MPTEPLALKHKDLLEPRFRSLQLNISEYTFANVYLFRTVHQFEVVFDFDIFLKGKTRDGFTYLMPTSSIQALDQAKLLKLVEGIDFLFPIPDEWLQYFPAGVYRNEYKVEDSDYLFSALKLQIYSGRHLAGRRNLVKQFLAQYDVEVFPLTKDRIIDAQKVLNLWNENTHHTEETDFEACKEGLEKIEILGLSGRIYYIENRPVGFILGEELNREVYVVHFAKTDVLYKGIYQFMYQNFAKSLGCRYVHINLEQDLGDPGLHRAKQAYLPEKLIPKYRLIVLKKSNS